VHLSVEQNSIASASFETYGCPVAIACGSWLTSWVTGKTFTQAAVIEPGDLEKVLGGLPLGKEHCAALAVNALKDALRQCTEEGTSS
jgi:NifU-like protein involved in Fe-S cluster formation